MSIFFAILLPGLLLIAIGVPLLISNSLVVSTLKGLPRSSVATALFWGGGSLWFLYKVWTMSAADLAVFDSSTPWLIFFAALAVAAFYVVPDFLAIRGLSVLVLLASWQILMGVFGEYGVTLFLKVIVYIAIVLAIYLGCVPYRARDIIQWLFQRLPRARALGAFLLIYGLLLVGIAISY